MTSRRPSASSAARAPRPGSSSGDGSRIFRVYSKALTTEQVQRAVGRRRAGQPGRARGLDRPRRHERGHAQPHAAGRAGRDVEHQRSVRRHGPGRGHPSRRRARGRHGDAQRRRSRTAGSPTRESFPVTVKQRVAIPADQLRTGLVHFYKLDETAGTTLADSGTAGARHATLVNPGKATLTGAGVTLNPDALRRLADGRAREAARRRHGRHDRAERRLRHPDRPGQRRRPPPLELRAQDGLRRRAPATRARSSARTPGACARA